MFKKVYEKMIPSLGDLKVEMDACFAAGETDKAISLIEQVYAACDELMAAPVHSENKSSD